MKKLVFVLVTTVLLSFTSSAQAAEIQGTFSLAPHKSDNVGEVVESAVAGMNFFIRHFAREKIARAAVANKEVTITSNGDKLIIRADGRRLPVTSADGARTTYRNRDGDVAHVQTRLEGNRLKQVFTTKKGSRTNLCELSSDGQEMAMKVIIQSVYFERPITYRLVYQKSS